MSETVPERPSGGSRAKGLFTQHIGPLPMWGWLAVIGGGLIAWRLYSNSKANSAGTAAGTSAADVPQFVNQTYTTVTPPVIQQPSPNPQPWIDYGFRPVPTPQPKQTLKRTWTAPTGGVSTLAQIAQRLTGTADAGSLTPANKIAQDFINGPYKRNKNAKVPKGAVFTYTEGTVANKGQAA